MIFHVIRISHKTGRNSSFAQIQSTIFDKQMKVGTKFQLDASE